MKKMFKKALPLLLVLVSYCGFNNTAEAHSVQLAYCGNCGGNLRLWVEHWHSTASPSTTTMTISLTVGATTTTTTGSPLTNLQNTPLNQLPGCTTPPVVFASCPTYMNTYLDWVNYDFLGVPCGVPVSITVVSGNSAFTSDGCGMMPASTGTFTIPCVQAASASFVPPLNVCLGTPMQFIDLSGPVGQITWQWDFGDNSPIDTNQHPTHTYAAPGNYNVKLTINTSLNCPDDTTIQVTVEDYPTPNFTSVIGCTGTPSTFTDQSTITFGSITQWNWDFGDGNTSTQQNPTNTYLVGGNYTVKLIATSSGGCVDSVSQQISVPTSPTADLALDSFICFGDVANFTDLSTIAAPGNMTHLLWDFGVPAPVSNDTSNLGTPTYNYGLPGTYTVTLVATGDGQCRDTAYGTIIVENKPVTAFAVTHECEGTASQFTDQSLTPINSVTNWMWDFGDGAGTSTIQNPTYTYGAPGSYTVKMISYVHPACPDSMERVVHVHDVPVAEFVGDVLAGCHPHCTNFTNQSQVANGQIVTNAWNMGDGSLFGSVDVSHCYENFGMGVRTFDVSLTVTTDSGCTDVETKSAYISVYPVPIASFNPDPDVVTIDVSTVNFENRSGGGTIHTWDFGDGTGSSAKNPKHDYQDTGKYVVWLYEENQWGCRDSTWKLIRVDPVWHVHIPNAFTPGNSDAQNDRWKAETFGIVEMTTYVYNRWGEQVWKGEGLDASWDGFYKGERTETETFVYMIECKTILGEHKEFRGKVTLLK